MPQRIQPKTLRKASIQSIADNYSYWCIIKGHSVSQSDFISPFQYLDDDMIQELIDCLYGRSRIDRWISTSRTRQLTISAGDLRFLFHHNIRRLNLRRLICFPSSVIPMFILAVQARCQRLTHLNLAGLYDVQPNVLCELVSHLPQLASLQLNHTKTDFAVLDAIADNCPKLVDLNLERCDGLRNMDHLLSSCLEEMQLKRLMLSEGMKGLSVDTVVDLLNSHQDLKSLGECELVCQALDQMYGKEYEIQKEVKDTWILNLAYINMYGRSHGGTLDGELAILCCPYLVAFALNLVDGNILSVNAFSKLKYLKSLRVRGHSPYFTKDSTYKYIVPILEKIGPTLTYLDLHNVDECIILIGELCPNLQTLHIQVYEASKVSTSKQIAGNRQFRQLQVLQIVVYRRKELIPAETLSMVLENAVEITRLSFHGVQNLTDRIILQAREKHSFRFLTRAEFSECGPISQKTGMVFLSLENPLKHLAFTRCPYIRRKHGESLKEFAEERQFDTYISVYNFVPMACDFDVVNPRFDYPFWENLE